MKARYIPNVVARPFSIAKDYVELVATSDRYDRATLHRSPGSVGSRREGFASRGANDGRLGLGDGRRFGLGSCTLLAAAAVRGGALGRLGSGGVVLRSQHARLPHAKLCLLQLAFEFVLHAIAAEEHALALGTTLALAIRRTPYVPCVRYGPNNRHVVAAADGEAAFGPAAVADSVAATRHMPNTPRGLFTQNRMEKNE